MRDLEGCDEMTGPNLGRRRRQGPRVPFAACLDVHDRSIEHRGVVDVRRAGGREVALIRVVRSFRKLHAGNQLGNQEVEIGIALTVPVGGHVDRDTAHRCGEVGAVIQIEPAQKVLVGFALAAVLRDDDAGHGLEHFAIAHQAHFSGRS